MAAGALFGLSFELVALRIKEAAAHAPLVSDTLGLGLCCRGSNVFSWGLLFACTRYMGHPADFRIFYIFCCRFGTDRTFRPKFCGHLREDVCYAGRSSAKVKMDQKCTSVAPVHTESTFFGKIGNVSFSLSGNRGYPKVVKKDSGGATLGHIEVPT